VGVIVGVGVRVPAGVVVGVTVGVGVFEQHEVCNSDIFCMKCVDEPLVSEINLTHFSSPFNSAVKISFTTNFVP